MKVLVILGSPRKGNTFRACEEFREHLQRRCTAEFEYVWLKDADMAPCKGCFVCFPHGEEKCPGRDDDVHLIEQKMLDADGVIFATPVYSFTVSGLMKTFIDRISYTGHRPRFFGKKAFLLVTTGMMGDDDTLKYLKKITWAWGFACAGTVGLKTPNGTVPRYRAEMNARLLEKAARKFSSELLSTRRKNPGIREVIHFYGARGAISQLERISPADYQYWKARGWFSAEAHYFMDVPVGLVYRVIGNIIESVAKRWVRRDVPELTCGTG